MKKLLGITLGIMTALGGFVDLGQIVFTMQAGALFGYKLVWVILLGTVAIILYMEMCGRVAVVAREPVFSTVRNRLGFRIGLVTLIASNLLNLLTCAAELAGIATNPTSIRFSACLCSPPASSGFVARPKAVGSAIHSKQSRGRFT